MPSVPHKDHRGTHSIWTIHGSPWCNLLVHSVQPSCTKVLVVLCWTASVGSAGKVTHSTGAKKLLHDQVCGCGRIPLVNSAWTWLTKRLIKFMSRFASQPARNTMENLKCPAKLHGVAEELETWQVQVSTTWTTNILKDPKGPTILTCRTSRDHTKPRAFKVWSAIPIFLEVAIRSAIVPG